MKKADLSVNLIFTLVIVVISIAVLLGVFALALPNFSKDMYCKTFFHIQKSTFIPKAIRADAGYCTSTQVIETAYFYREADVLNQTTAYLFACWQKSDFGRLQKPFICYELTSNYTQEKVTLTQIENLLQQEDMCGYFPVSDECGGDKRLVIVNGEIKISVVNSALIEYNGSHIIVS